VAENAVEMKDICKWFPGVCALNQVDFACAQGEVHALVGENGAGKSTLMKILAGAYSNDTGCIVIEGEEKSFSSPKDAQRCGISIIYQEFNLLPELSVAENIFLGREPRRLGFIDNKALKARAAGLLDELGVELDLDRKVKTLGVAQQQMVEIAKALSMNARIIMMDEPSAVVSGKELEALFKMIRTLKEKSAAIIYISHRLDEIFQIADKATVLKDGEIVGTVHTCDVDKSDIIRMMVGRSLDETFPPLNRETGCAVLEVKGLSQGAQLRDISFEVRKGEVLGIAGLVGAGRTALARGIFGADPLEAGELVFEGCRIRRLSPKRSIQRGIALLTECRADDGIVQCLGVRENMSLATINNFSSWGWMRQEKEREFCQDFIDRFAIATPHQDQKIQFLSGGNQQKAILAKWLNIKPKLLILDEPTRGIDVGAKAEIYELIRKLALKGAGIIMISSELPEILGMSDRVLVMHEGRITGELRPEEASEEAIMLLATGNGGRAA
jgi:ribose transport system ATP-binding protein